MYSHVDYVFTYHELNQTTTTTTTTETGVGRRFLGNRILVIGITAPERVSAHMPHSLPHSLAQNHDAQRSDDPAKRAFCGWVGPFVWKEKSTVGAVVGGCGATTTNALLAPQNKHISYTTQVDPSLFPTNGAFQSSTFVFLPHLSVTRSMYATVDCE